MEWLAKATNEVSHFLFMKKLIAIVNISINSNIDCYSQYHQLIYFLQFNESATLVVRKEVFTKFNTLHIQMLPVLFLSLWAPVLGILNPQHLSEILAIGILIGQPYF